MNDSVYRSMLHEMLDELINLRLKIKEMEKHPANQEAVEERQKDNRLYAKCMENPTYVIIDDTKPIKILQKGTPVIAIREYKKIEDTMYIRVQYANSKFGWVRIGALEFEVERNG